MKLTDLKETVVAAIQQDSELDTYCNLYYDKSIAVYGEFSGELPPVPADCPCIIVHSPAKRAHQRRREVEYGMTADFWFYDTTDEARADDAEISGASEHLLESMRLARLAVIAALPNNLSCGFTETTDTVYSWPLLPGETVFEFEEEVTIGQNPVAD